MVLVLMGTMKINVRAFQAVQPTVLFAESPRDNNGRNGRKRRTMKTGRWRCDEEGTMGY